MNDDRHLSGEEKRAKLREEYKRELQLRREVEQRAAGAIRMNKLDAEVAKMEQIANGDDTEDWTRRLNETAAMAEAKLDIALGNANPGTTAATDAPTATAAHTGQPASKTLGDVEAKPDATPAAEASETDIAANASSHTRKSLGDDEV